MAFKPGQLAAEAKERAVEQGQRARRPIKSSEAKEILEAEKVYREGVTSIKDLIAPASMRIEPRLIELNGRYLTTLFVVNYPRYISVGWFSPIINYNAPLDIAMFFYPVKSEVFLIRPLCDYLRRLQG